MIKGCVTLLVFCVVLFAVVKLANRGGSETGKTGTARAETTQAADITETPTPTPTPTAPPNGPWTITQYPCTIADTQHMFYTVENQQGGLAVIDGGWDSEADNVRQVIMDKGGVVDTWILTHPHPDHIGAFEQIYPDLQGITIKHIYAIPMSYDGYNSSADEWDEFNVFDRFAQLATNMPELEYLREGDQKDIVGLQMNLYNSFDNSLIGTTNDIANDSAMVFKLTGNSQSMLFCADCGVSREKHLTETYGDQLKADYIQMGHHGNSSLSDAFYTNIGASTAFFDLPDSILKDSEKYTASHYVELMTGLGAKIYSFNTGANVITLE